MPFGTHQCTRQLPPLRRQQWIKLMHSLKCFLLEKKTTGEGVLGRGRSLRSCFLPTYRQQGTENPRASVQPACMVTGSRQHSRQEERLVTTEADASPAGTGNKDMGVGRVGVPFFWGLQPEDLEQWSAVGWEKSPTGKASA